MITHADDAGDGTDRAPDDPLTVILRPPSGHLAPPPGHYEAVRRGAVRRRLLRTAVAVGATCAVATLALLPLRLGGSEAPAAPTVPMAPPPASDRSAVPAPSTSPVPSVPDPTEGSRTPDRGTDTDTARPTLGPARTVPPSEASPAPSAESSTPSMAPSGSGTRR
ncbi:hypothetical protein NFX46_08140 [Streptomyces phaeoluteigriseus]|uniref:Cellulase n=1 Tax=Streptomyces phaeoluteigriseus TaxID=114686 RepID=A0ABY4Z4U2_9ACTN|nr:hypothetical protein [Streptomyces phaeoluteigriseus]USQ83764.1 hypothetical protein NFX46_08140 [Streptomyces phaeoluteigriseus]